MKNINTKTYDMNNLTHAEAVAIVGESLIEELLALPAEATGHINPNDDRVHFCATLELDNPQECSAITANYFINKSDFDNPELELDNLDWVAEVYTII